MEKRRNIKLISITALIGLLLAYGCGGETQHKAEEHKRPIKKAKKETTLSKTSSSSAKKETKIGGEIKENTVLKLENSPYYITRELVVLPDVKLTIEPGVEIKVATYTAIMVKGNFHAIGTESKKIKFTCADSNDLWDGIQFTDTSFDYASDDLIEGHGCIVEHCQIERAKTAIICEKSSPVIRNNEFKNNEEAVKCRSWANPLVAYNFITDNNIGVSCEEYSSPNINHNTIIGKEGKGISCVNYSSPQITYNTVFGGGITWWKGIICQNASKPVINFNNIYANGGYNFYYVKLTPGEVSPDVDAKNNWWGLEDTEAVSKMIYDKLDKTDLGEVKLNPFSKTKIKEASHKG